MNSNNSTSTSSTVKSKSKITTKRLLYIFCSICVVLICVTFFTDKLTKPIRYALSRVVTPMQSGVNNIGLWFYDTRQNMKEVSALRDENKLLQEEIAELTEKNKQLEQDSYELARLRELYKLDQKYAGYDKVGARVIARDNTNWFNRFTVDKGSEDGIKEGMNVIADGGLVGIVISVDKKSCVIRSIIDDSSYVSAMLIGTGETCTVKGNLKLINDGILEVANFKSTVDVSAGDTIVTSNISDKYLEGILIGYIKEIDVDKNNLTQSGYIIPVVDFEHLQEVLIITKLKE